MFYNDRVAKLIVVVGFVFLIAYICISSGCTFWYGLLYTAAFSGALGFGMAWMSIPGCFCTKTVVYYGNQTNFNQPD